MKYLFVFIFSSLLLWADAHIFVYHRFGDSRHPSTNTTNEQLRADFALFKTKGYEVVSLEKLVNALGSKQAISDKWVVLTIDDNFKSFYTNGLPIFKEYGYPFSLFVYVEATQKKYPDYLSWDELKEVSKYGSLEFHSYGHPHLTDLSDTQIITDLDRGLALFEKNLSIKPKFFSYPYGEFSPRVKELVSAYGFEAIINQNIGAVGSHSDAYDLDRIALVGKSNLNYYLQKRSLDANWLEPLEFPKSGIIERLHVKTAQKATLGSVYFSGENWKQIDLENGDFDIQINKKIKETRSRIVVQIGDKIATKLLIKDAHANK